MGKNAGRGLAFLARLASLVRRVGAGANAGSSGRAALPPAANRGVGTLLGAVERLAGGAAANSAAPGGQAMETAGEGGILSELDRLLETLAGAAQGGTETADGNRAMGSSTAASGSSGVMPGSDVPAGEASRGATAGAGAPLRGDAIDQVFAEAPRSTSVVSLRDAPEVAAFRNELTDGLIRVDTANQLLRLINEVVVRVLR